MNKQEYTVFEFFRSLKNHLKLVALGIILMVAAIQARGQELVIPNQLKFLALGDSYTIGQGVSRAERWPNQLVSVLETIGYQVDELKIIAQTGWTTGSLLNAIETEVLSQDYNLVSLLIGVNNQFQGRSEQEYALEFTELLEKALFYSNNDPKRVFVVNIPDYGFTPYGQNFSNVSEAIDRFNTINKEITASYNLVYVDIVDISRRAAIDPELVASDGLHPSGKMYKEWVAEIMKVAILEEIVTAYEPEALVDELRIYPNPVNDFVKVPNDVTHIEISNALGMVVYSTNNIESAQLDLSFLKQGTYQIRLISNNSTATHRFIKD